VVGRNRGWIKGGGKTISCVRSLRGVRTVNKEKPGRGEKELKGLSDSTKYLSKTKRETLTGLLERKGQNWLHTGEGGDISVASG